MAEDPSARTGVAALAAAWTSTEATTTTEATAAAAAAAAAAAKQRRTRTSPTQDCIEWDTAGHLQDPRRVADPTFREERPSPDSNHGEILTPVVPRKRRRRPPLRNVLATTTEARGGGGGGEDQQLHQKLLVATDPTTTDATESSSSSSSSSTAPSSSAMMVTTSDSRNSSLTFHRMFSHNNLLVENRPVPANRSSRTNPFADEETAGTENAWMVSKPPPPPPAASLVLQQEQDEGEEEQANFIIKKHSTASSNNEDEDDDNFFADFSDEQLAQIDAIAIHSSQSNHQQQRGSGAISPMAVPHVTNKTFLHQPPPTHHNQSIPQQRQPPAAGPLPPHQPPNHPLATTATTTTTTYNHQEAPPPPPTTGNNKDDDDDDSFFGDFPDFDVDEAAKTALAHRDQSQNQILTTASTTTMMSNTTKKSAAKTSPGAYFDDDWTDEDMAAIEAGAATTLTFTREEQRSLRNRHHPSYERPSSSTTTATEDQRNGTDWPAAGDLYLVGSWSQMDVRVGDTIHLCSLLGRTNTQVLPKSVGGGRNGGDDDDDDLVMIVHPDLLLAPTIISEGVACPRRAVLKSRLGSTGLTTKSALFGTLRHSLFEEAMKHQNFTRPFLVKHIGRLVRQKAEDLLSCNVTSKETEQELYKVMPMLQMFANRHTTFGNNPVKRQGMPLENYLSTKPPVHFMATEAEAVEEPMVCPELGLKGNIDMIAKAATGMFHPERFMGVELKTSHRQAIRSEHTGQLLLYILMMQARHGQDIAADSGVLLYLNNEDLRALHILFDLRNAKDLLSVRNQVAIGQVLAGSSRDDVESVGVDLARSGGWKRSEPPEAPIVFPDMINDDYACKRCYSNRECSTYDATLKLCNNEPPSKLGAAFTSHLGKEELEYFLKWDKLIDFEVEAEGSSIARSWLTGSDEPDITTSSAVFALAFESDRSMPVLDLDESCGRQDVAYFSRTGAGPASSLEDSLSIGTRVVVSMDTTTLKLASNKTWKTVQRPQMHIARGDVYESSVHRVGLRVSYDDLVRLHKLVFRALPTKLRFRIDRDSFSTGTGTLKQNLINLLTGDKKTNSEPGTTVEGTRLPRLRELLLKLHPPKYDDDWKGELMFQRSVTSPVANQNPSCDLACLKEEFQTLNMDQQSAVRKVFVAKDYTLIQGLPGTGKTRTIAFIVKLLVAHNKRVLVTSYTHSAVDNVLMKLIDDGMAATDAQSPVSTIARVDRYFKCHERVKQFIVENLASKLEDDIGADLPSAESIRKVVSSAMVVGVSALTIPRSSLLIDQHFDVVIVDEAGQISQPAIIGALMAAKSFVLVGDQMQLPPIAISELSTERGFCVSMMQRLAESNADAIVQLGVQYRMHQDICEISNDIVYKGALKCANAFVATQQVELRGFPDGLTSIHGDRTQRGWVEKAIHPSTAVIFLNTDTCTQNPDSEASFQPLEHHSVGAGNTGTVNSTEASVVQLIVNSFVSCGMTESDVGVIVPFRAQLRLLNSYSAVVRWKEAGLELSTIDSYQGRDKQVIIISFTRSNTKGRVGRLLEDFRRLNVAVTRAKCKLIMIGSYATLTKGSEVLRPVLEKLKNSNMIVDLPTMPVASTQP